MAQRNATKRTAEEWQDAFYSLEERHRQLQQKLNEREEEVKLMKVSQRRSLSTHPQSSQLLSTSGPMRTNSRKSVNNNNNNNGPSYKLQDKHQKPIEINKNQSDRNVQFISVPSAARKDDAAAVTAELNDKINLSSPWSAAPPPDPSMVWGMENSIQNYVTANALYHANEELRQRLDEAVTLVKTLQHELASSRSLTNGTQAKLEEATQQVHQLVRERDVACQKLSVAQHAISDLERNLHQRQQEEERIRFGLETQITELRSRLVVGADSNEQLTRDVRTLLTEVKEKSSEVQTLRSRLCLTEASLSSQKQNNESLLVELRNLNNQLINERKRLLSMTREAQLASMRADEAKNIETRLTEANESRCALEREYVKLMESLVGLTEGALRQAREEVQQENAEARAAAHHWEEISQLLYKDIAQRTQAHLQCREECELAKRDRDEASMALRDAWAELKLCRAKLDIVWPTHLDDTRDLTPAEILSTFGNYRAVFRHKMKQKYQKKQHQLTSGVGEIESTNNLSGLPISSKYNNINIDDCDDVGEITIELCDIPLEEQVRELHEANSVLLAEIEQLRITNELQTERLRMMEGHVQQEREAVQASAEALEKREEATQNFLQTQLDRVSFLESQVRSLRGYDVSPNMSLRELNPGETVFELFLGQILSTETPEGVGLRNTFPPVFCSIDFLLHETVTTPIVTGLNAFLDTTVSFCVAMDALLQCYLQSRELLVQLHRVRSQDEIQELTYNENDAGERLYATIAEGNVNLWSIVADEKSRNAQRPTLKGHIPLYTSNGHHIASVEFCVTVRTPFSESFRALAAEAAKGWHPKPITNNNNNNNNNNSARAKIEGILRGKITGGEGEREGTTTTANIGKEIRETSLSSPALVKTLNKLRSEGRMQLIATPHHSETYDRVSTTSSSTSLLETGSHEKPSGFTLVPRAAALASVFPAANSSDAAIRVLVVDICKLILPRHIPHVPRLSCYYRLAPLGRDVYLPAPPTARYEFEYLQEGGAGGTRFPIASMRDLLAVTREPFMLFFFDESSIIQSETSRRGRLGEGPYWAVALAEWRLALQQPEEYIFLELPLINQQGIPIQGAVVQVRLLATSKTQSAEASLIGAIERVRSVSNTPQQKQQQHRQEQHNIAISPEVYNTNLYSTTTGNNSGVRDMHGIINNSHNRGGSEESLDMEMIRRHLEG